MKPDARAFLLSVIRYQSLRHARGSTENREYGVLENMLRETPTEAIRPQYEQRSFRRMPLHTDGLVRTGAVDAPCTILDVSGTGARIRDETGLSREDLDDGRTLTLRLAPGGSTLRIDLPVEVVRRDATTGTHGLRFVGAPLIMYQRLQGNRDLVARDGVADPAETPANRAQAAVA